jgi:multicomponent Na+:H+ antiporter subunit E
MKHIPKFIILYIIWLLLTWPVNSVDVISGVIVSFLGVVLYINDEDYGIISFLSPEKLLWLFVYIAVVSGYFLKAAVKSGYLSLKTSSVLNPGIMRIKTSLKSQAALAVLANSLTLAADMLTVEVFSDGTLYVYCYNIDAGDAHNNKQNYIIAGKLERLLGKVFSTK